MGDSKKKVLVMMSTYNGEKHLWEQINSILHQKIEHELHLRIRDDGSSDATCQIIKDSIDSNPNMIELLKGENLGYNASFFTLLKGADGYDYYAFSDQDDVWLEDKLKVACDAIDGVKEDIPVLYASASYLVHDDLVPYGVTRKKERELSLYNTIIQNICPGHSQVMNNRMVGMLKDDIDTSRIYVYDSWIVNVANLFGTIIFDNEAHTFYRQYEGNQLGSGAGVMGQLLSSVKRTRSNDGMKYRRQIEYFVEKYESELKKNDQYGELERFLSAKTFPQRLEYCLTGKLYRQKPVETFAFRCAIVMGRY